MNTIRPIQGIISFFESLKSDSTSTTMANPLSDRQLEKLRIASFKLQLLEIDIVKLRSMFDKINNRPVIEDSDTTDYPYAKSTPIRMSEFTTISDKLYQRLDEYPSPGVTYNSVEDN